MREGLKSTVDYKFPILLYDGTCNFCNASVATIVKHESNSMIRFASLQSDLANELLQQQFKQEQPDSLIFIQNEQVHYYADAIFAMKHHLKWYFKLPLFCLELFRGKFADFCYQQIAKKRHSIIRKDVCFVPDPCLRRRFL